MRFQGPSVVFASVFPSDYPKPLPHFSMLRCLLATVSVKTTLYIGGNSIHLDKDHCFVSLEWYTIEMIYHYH